MIIVAIILGVANIGLGFLIKRYPNMLSGYNTMSKAKRANVDIAAIAKLMSRYMIGAGVASIVITAALPYLGLGDYAIVGLVYPLLIATLIASIKSQRYDHNKRSRLSRYSAAMIIAAVTLFVSFALFRSSTPSPISIEGDMLIIEGIYGTSTPLEQIESVELLESLPKIGARVNGSDTGSSLKGNFRIKDKEMGVCLLYLKPRSAPYVYVKRAEGRDIIFNTPDSLTTKELYEALAERCNVD